MIQIANVLTVYGENDNKPLVKNIFTLKGCLPIVGAQVISSEKEEDMLLKWRVFLQACDPDIITGYNVQNFDLVSVFMQILTLIHPRCSQLTHHHLLSILNSLIYSTELMLCAREKVTKQ